MPRKPKLKPKKKVIKPKPKNPKLFPCPGCGYAKGKFNNHPTVRKTVVCEKCGWTAEKRLVRDLIRNWLNSP